MEYFNQTLAQFQIWDLSDKQDGQKNDCQVSNLDYIWTSYLHQTCLNITVYMWTVSKSEEAVDCKH